MAVRFTSRIRQWSDLEVMQIDKVVAQIATDIDRVAKLNAPKGETKNLRDSGVIKKVGNAHYSITFGGNKVPYAKRRHYENKKNPQTLRYLERAGDDTSRNIKRYLKDL